VTITNGEADICLLDTICKAVSYEIPQLPTVIPKDWYDFHLQSDECSRKEAVKAAVKAAPKAVAGEALTGGAQEATQIAGKVNVGERDKFATKQTALDIFNAAAAEAAGSLAGTGVNVGTAAQDAASNPMVAAEFESTFSIDIANSIADLAGLASWTAYPNPVIAGQDVRLNIPVDITDARVMIFTSQGKLVADYNYAGNNNPMIVTTAGWSEGMYMVRLISKHAQGSLPVSVVR
jgi:hypothetical protein